MHIQGEISDYIDLDGSGEYVDVPDWILNHGTRSVVADEEVPALLWLAREINAQPDDIWDALRALRLDDSTLYRVTRKQKKDGTWKEICAPNKKLKNLQRRINKRMLRSWKPARNVFGFSGGSIVEALTPHLGSKSMLCVDLVDAFPSLSLMDVFSYLIQGREVSISWGLGRRRPHYTIEKYGYFSWYSARAFAELATFKKRLRRGAPTSPRIFDLVCEPLDKALQKLAAKVGGVYTRYADNIFFSMPTEDFPAPVRNAILRRIEGKRRSGPTFSWHKLKIVKLTGEAVHALGLNLFEGKLHNTRAFKRRLRLAVYHVRCLLDHGTDYEQAWQKLQGQMQFAQRETLSPQLCSDYAALEERIASLL